MEIVGIEKVEQVTNILGGGFPSEEIEARVAALVDSPMTARRLIDWIPEIFGLVLISHLVPKVTLPKTFSAKNVGGEWVEFEITSEPIGAAAAKIAVHMFHNGPQDAFKNIVSRSGLFATVNNALNAGAKMEGGTLGGPAFIGISAETYLPDL